MEIALSRLQSGQEGIIKYFNGGHEFQRKMNSMGVLLGEKIKVISSQPFSGPMVVRINNTRVAIGRGMAEKILVDL